jgi:cysteine-rich repeat protein
MRFTTLLFIVSLLLPACSCNEGTPFNEDGDVEEEDGIVEGTEADQETPDGRDVERDAVDGEDAEVAPECGNGIVELGEQCDDGTANSDTEPDACRSGCVLYHCGDAVMDTGEGCDDGNDVDTDVCKNNCSLPTCGNSEVEAGEDCDDGNDDNTDGCLDTCRSAACGDGYVHSGEEECDDRNHVDGDGCTGDCVFSCHGDDDCDDGNVCTDESCEVGGTGRLCVGSFNDNPCDDGDPCTEPDVCSAGTCRPGGNVCPCNVTADCGPFEDGDLCNGTLFCDTDHFCKVDPETIVECDPSADTDCEKNLCDPASGDCSMTAVPESTPCDDGDPCNDPDACDGLGACVGTDTGLTDCGGECVDLETNHDHCHACFYPCAFDEDCVAGSCTTHPWTPVGPGVEPSGGNVLAQAIGTEGTDPFVAMVLASSTLTNPVAVYRYRSGSWNRVPGLDDAATNADPAIDIDFDGGSPYVIFPDDRPSSGTPTTTTLRHCLGDLVTCADELYRTACLRNFSIAMDLDGQDAHFTTVGAGGCGIGVGYAWYDFSADAFDQHPGTVLGDGLLPWEGGGKSGIVIGDRPYVGLLGRNFATDPPTAVYVAYWDGGTSQWLPLDGDLAVHDGECLGAMSPGNNPCAVSLAKDSSGVLYAAWTENRDPNTRFVYVRRHDTTGWTLLGGALNDFADGGFGLGGSPAIYVHGADVFVAYQDFAGTNYRVYVKRWTGTSWEPVSDPLNNDLTRNAVDPDVTSIGAVLYVSLREDVGGGIYNVFVKSFP